MPSPLPLPDARRDLLVSLIDDATLLAPNALPMDAAVAGYRAMRSHSTAPALGSFLCPASRLIELSGALVATMAAGEAPWPITIVLEGDVGAAVSAEHAFAATMEPAARIVRATSPAAEEPATAFAMGMPVSVLLDVAGGPAHEPTVAARLLIDFVRSGLSCVPWGLHSAVRNAERPGILNLVGAAGLAVGDASETTVTAVLEETDPATFHLGRAGLTWRHLTVGSATLRRVRAAVMPAVATSRLSAILEDAGELWCADIQRNE